MLLIWCRIKCTSIKRILTAVKNIFSMTERKQQQQQQTNKQTTTTKQKQTNKQKTVHISVMFELSCLMVEQFDIICMQSRNLKT